MTGKMDKKTIEALHRKVVRKPGLVWDRFTAAQQKRAFEFAEQYKRFLDVAKTERLAADAIVKELSDNGFVEIGRATRKNKKIYRVYGNKAVAAAVVGKQKIGAGLNLIGAHIDSPRLDLKQNPLYEEVDLAMLKVHYYGGI